MKILLFKLVLAVLMLLLVLKLAGCATGGAAPGITSGTSPEQSDPEYWKMLEDQRGIGG